MTPLALTSLRLSHFRSYTSCVLECGQGPIAIFGPNGAGKTNLLEAVSMLSPGRGMRRAKTDDLAHSKSAIGWKIHAEIESSDFNGVTTGASLGERRSVEINEKMASQLALAEIARIVWLVPSMDRLWMEGAAERRGFLDRVAMSLTPDHASAVLSYEKAMRERNRLLKDQVSDPAWYTALEAQMALHGAAICQGRRNAVDRLANAQASASTSFPQASLSIETEGGDNEETLREEFAANRGRDIAAGRALLGPHRADLLASYAEKEMEARLCSTGEQKALLVSLILANARAIAADFGAAPILLLDEVAAHLDADRRAALYDELTELGAQAWMSGTGQELFEALGQRARYVEVTDGGTGSIAKQIS